jgi:DNA-binding LacI/PurR family transcriptional regulator
LKKAITIKDIAAKLNMSFSTVSKALNNDASISVATRERVKKLAAEWNYIPNEAARHFKLNKTFTLGLIIPNMLDQFFATAINGVEKIASAEKYNVIVSQTQEDEQKQGQMIDLMKRNRVDGLIIAITKNTEDMTPFKNMANIGIPVVFIARPPKDDSFDYVSTDNEGGASKATKFLLKKGHKRIAHLMGPDSLNVSHTRLRGYKSALVENRIVYDPALVKSVDLTRESTFEAMKQLMAMKNPPTAIFTFKNYISLDAIEYLKRHLPKKLSKIDFAGFGNLPLFEYLDHKPIASIEESSFEMGEEAARLLFHIMRQEDRQAAQHVQIRSNLVVHK